MTDPAPRPADPEGEAMFDLIDTISSEAFDSGMASANGDRTKSHERCDKAKADLRALLASHAARVREGCAKVCTAIADALAAKRYKIVEECGKSRDARTEAQGIALLQAQELGAVECAAALRSGAAPAPPSHGAAEEREACIALIQSEIDATRVALDDAKGAWFEECLVAMKVLQHAVEKLAARRLAALRSGAAHEDPDRALVELAERRRKEGVETIPDDEVAAHLAHPSPGAPRAESIRAALGEDAAGRPFSELLRVAADILLSSGGGPVEDCLRAKAQEVAEAERLLTSHLAAGSKWTKERPTKPGWYWQRIGQHNDQIVHITSAGGDLWAWHRGCERPVALNFIDAEWSGPIPEPEGK